MTASLPAEETGLPTGPITGVVAAWERLATSVVKVIKMTVIVFIDVLFDKAMVKLSPIFDPIKQAK